MGLTAAKKDSFLQQSAISNMGWEVLVDSQPALDIVYNQMYFDRPQQILARCHFAGIWEQI